MRFLNETRSSPHILGMFLLSIYLGLSPIYSLWGYGENELRLFKWMIVAAGVSFTLLSAAVAGRLSLPGGYWGPLGFAALLLLSVPGIWQAVDGHTTLMFLADISYCAAFLWCFYWLAREGRNCGGILLGALGILSIFSAVHIVATLQNAAGFCEWEYLMRSIYGSHYTAWSISLALFLPAIALLPVVIENRAGHLMTLVGAVYFVLLLGSLFIGGGRAGLAGVLVSLVALAFIKSTRAAVLITAAVILVVSVLAFDESCSHHLRLYQLRGGFSQDRLFSLSADSLGTGRIAGYREAFGRIAERPLIGHGLGQTDVEGVHRSSVEIHSLWLKWAAYCGILAPLVFAVMVISLARRGLWLAFRGPEDSIGRTTSAALLLILASGVIASLTQPNALIGSFQYTAVWWAAAGILLGKYARIRGGDWRLPLGRAPDRDEQGQPLRQENSLCSKLP